jgi:hypothetical protein
MFRPPSEKESHHLCSCDEHNRKSDKKYDANVCTFRECIKSGDVEMDIGKQPELLLVWEVAKVYGRIAVGVSAVVHV